MKLSQSTVEEMNDVAREWNWDNIEDEDTAGKVTILQGLYMRLSWVEDGVEDEEYKDIVAGAMKIIEALQRDIKVKI